MPLARAWLTSCSATPCSSNAGTTGSSCAAAATTSIVSVMVCLLSDFRPASSTVQPTVPFGRLGDGSGVCEVVEHGAVDDGGEVSLQASAGFGCGFAFAAFAGEVVAGFGVPAGLDHGNGEQCPIELTVAATGQTVAVGVAAGGWDRCGARVRRERGGAAEVTHVVGFTQDLGSHQRTDTGNGDQMLMRPQLEGGADVGLHRLDLIGEAVQPADRCHCEFGPHRVAGS